MIPLLNPIAARADRYEQMTSLPSIALYVTVWLTLLKALDATARPHRVTCARCALPLERRRLGEPVCRCRS